MVSVAESLAAIERERAEAEARAAAHDAKKNFYLSRGWRALRYKALRENAQKHGGQITCEVCGSIAGPWHADHIVPRSRDRSRELDPTNVAIKCAACNTGKGNADSLVWAGGRIRGSEPPA